MKSLRNILLRISNYMHYIYLLIFIFVVLKYYLQTTMFELYYTDNIYKIVRWALIVYVVVSMIIWTVTKKYELWAELGFMLALLMCAWIVEYMIGDAQVLDIALLIVGAKNVPWRKIAYCYLCIAVIIQIAAYYGVSAGIVSDMTYKSERGIRRSLGIIYPTDLLAHILFIELVYVSLRDKRLTFVEIIIMELSGYMVYQQSGARNDFMCISLLCVLLCIVKALRLNNIYIYNYKWIKVLCLSMLIIAVICVVVPVFYDSSKQIWLKLDSVISNRISLSYQAIARYGVRAFGSKIKENTYAYGEYFFIDSSYVRIAVRYGWVFLSMIIYVFILSFNKIIQKHRDYMIIVMIIMLLFGVIEHHLIEIAYCPIWYMVFSYMGDKKLKGETPHDR